MPANPYKKYKEEDYDVTQVGLSNILNAGSEPGQKKYTSSLLKPYLTLTGPDTNEPAMVVDNKFNQLSTTGGLSSLQAETQAAEENFSKQAETIQKISDVKDQLTQPKEYYNQTTGLLAVPGHVEAGMRAGGKAVLDVVASGIISGGYYNSIVNWASEESWQNDIKNAQETNDKNYQTFLKKMGIYNMEVNERGKWSRESFIDFSSLAGMNSNPSFFATLNPESIRVREDNGKYRAPTDDEMAWFYKYRNLMRTRANEANTANLQKLFNEEFAESSAWLDEVSDARGNKYTTARNVSNVVGAAVGSALLFELAAAPAGAVNFAGQALKAKSIKTAITTSNNAWRGSFLTNPYYALSAREFAYAKAGVEYAGSMSAGSITGGTLTFANAYMQQFTETKAQALAAGWDPVSASRIASKNAGLQAIVESVGYERFLHGFLMQSGTFNKFLTNATIAEGMEEVIQTGIDDVFINRYGIDYTTMKELAGNMFMSFFGGVAGATAMGGIHFLTNFGGHLVTGDSAAVLGQDIKTENTDEFLDKAEAFQMADSQKNSAMSSFEERMQREMMEEPEERGTLQKPTDGKAIETLKNAAKNTPKALPYEKDYNWAPDVITQMNFGQKAAFDNFCLENNVDINDQEEMRNALMVWTGNDSATFVADENAEDAKMDIAKKELQSVLDKLSDNVFAEQLKEDVKKDILGGEREYILTQAKKEFKRRMKEEQPNVSDKQIEDAWSTIGLPMFTTEVETSGITMALADEAMENVATVLQDESVAALTREEVDKAAKKSKNVINTDALNIALTGEGIEKYDAQWEVAKQILENRIVRATGNRQLGQAIGKLLQAAYYEQLLNTPEVSPVTFVSKAAPDFVTNAALRRNNIRIAGLQGLEGKVQQASAYATAKDIKMFSQVIVNQIKQYHLAEDGEQKQQLGNSILYQIFGKDSSDIKIEDALEFLDTVAREELLLHKHIGAGSLVSFFTESDITVMALMRLKGATEEEIMTAFGIGQSDEKLLARIVENYESAVQVYYPMPNNQQRADLEMLGAKLRKENVEIEGATIGKQSTQSTIYLSDNQNAKETAETVVHEMTHWAQILGGNVAESIENSALMALGQYQQMSLGETSFGTLPYSNRGIVQLHNKIREILNVEERGYTEEEIQETVVEFVIRYLTGQFKANTPELTQTFNSILSVRPSSENEPGSRFNELTQSQKTELSRLLKETFDNSVIKHAQGQIQQGEQLRQDLRESLSKVDITSEIAPSYQLYEQILTKLNAIKDNTIIVNDAMATLAKAYDNFVKDSDDKKFKSAIVATTIDAIKKLEKEGKMAMVNIMYYKSNIDSNGENFEDLKIQNELLRGYKKLDKAERKKRRAEKDFAQKTDKESAEKLISSANEVKERMAYIKSLEKQVGRKLTPEEREQAESVLMNLGSGDVYDNVEVVSLEHMRNNELDADERYDRRSSKDDPYAFRRIKKQDRRTDTEKMVRTPTIKEDIKNEAKKFSLKEFSQAANFISASIVDWANRVHPALGAAIQASIYDSTQMKTFNKELAAHWYKTFEEFNKRQVEKGEPPISPEFFDRYKNMLINHRRSDAFAIMENRLKNEDDLRQNLQRIHSLIAKRLDDSYKLMVQMGFKLEEIENYFPAIVNNMDAFAEITKKKAQEASAASGKEMSELARFLNGKRESQIQKASRKAKSTEDITRANAINELIKNSTKIAGAPSLYRTQEFNKDMDYNMAYANPFEAFVDYCDDVANKWFEYKLVGEAKKIKDENGKLIVNQEAGKIGLLMNDLRYGENNSGYVYNPDAEDDFVRELNALLMKKDFGPSLIDSMKQLQTMMTLGRFSSALNQFLEMGPTMMRYGLLPSVKAMFQSLAKNAPLTIQDLGIQPMDEISRVDEGGMAKLVKFFLNVNGFTKADILMKNTVIVSSLMNAQEMLARDDEYGNEDETYGQRKFHEAFDKSFPKPLYNDAQRTQIKADLKEGKLTPQVKLYLRNALATTQPIDIAEVPNTFNRLGKFGRSMYFLSTVSVKQMRYIWNELVTQWKRKPKDAAISMVRFIWFSCLAGIPPDWLKDIINGKQPNIKETASYAPLQFFMMNKYFMSMTKDKGAMSALAASRFTIHNQFVDDLSMAIVNREPWYLVKSAPLIDIIYKWEGPGRKQMVRHNEAINTYQPVVEQLFVKPLKRKADFFGWKW